MKSVMRGLIASMGALLLIAGLAVGSAVASNPSGDAVCSTLPCVVSADLYTVDQNNDAMDPGFERTPAGQLPNSVAWQDNGAGNAWKIVTDANNSHGGNRFAERSGDGTASTRNLANKFFADAREGEKWAISGWFRAINADPSSFGEVALQWLNKDGAQIGISGFTTPPPALAHWKLITGQATAPALTASVRGVFAVSGHAAGSWYVDDMVVRLKTTLTGFGLNATNNQFSSTFDVDTTQVQSRVTGSCETAAINKIHQDGTVDCMSIGTRFDKTIPVPGAGAETRKIVLDGDLRIDLSCGTDSDGHHSASLLLEAGGLGAGIARYAFETTKGTLLGTTSVSPNFSVSLGSVTNTDSSQGGLGVGTITYRDGSDVATVNLSFGVDSSECSGVGTGLAGPPS